VKVPTTSYLHPLFAILLAAFSSPVPASEPTYWAGLNGGPYTVGFTVLDIRDSSREYGDSPFRPLRMGVWYPAEDATGSLMSFGQYIRAFEDSEQAWLERLEEDSARSRAQNLATAAALDADPVDSSFPLIYYAPGYGSTPTIHAATLEFLASHGFVVASISSAGAQPGGMTFDAEGINAQASDIDFAIDKLVGREDVNRDRIGIVGFSMGAAAGIVAAMRRSDIKTVISLDGLEGMPDGPDVIRPATGFEPARFNADFLRFGRAFPTEARSMIEELTRSDRYLLEIPSASHLDFIPSSAFAAAAGESVTEDSLAIYQAASLALLAFLDRSLASAGPVQEQSEDSPLLGPTDIAIADALHTALSDPRIKSLRSRVGYKYLKQK
jgi:dienelactone hydrolase